MITELKKVDPEIVPGKQIEVVEYKIRNYRLHQVLEQLSRLLLFCLECDSNNTSSKAIPNEIVDIRLQWKNVKDEHVFSMNHNDFPTGSHEYAYSMSLVAGKEIQKIRNVKLKRIVSEIFNAARVMLSVDSANTQGFIAQEDDAKIQKMFTLVDDTLDRWIGTGSDTNDTGILAPAFEKLGELQPDVDSDFAEILEPSRSLPKPKLPFDRDWLIEHILISIKSFDICACPR
jgi:hypothetical protein